MYGFRTKITLVEDKPCTLGTTCRGQPDDLRQDQIPMSKDKVLSGQYQKEIKQDENQFMVDHNLFMKDQNLFMKDQNQFMKDQNKFLMEQNHFTIDQNKFSQSVLRHRTDDNFISSKDTWFDPESSRIILDRQSGENFRSDGPPDCRVRRVQCVPSS